MLRPRFKITICDLEAVARGSFEITDCDFKRETSSQVN
jgi:hypothetical protein